MFPRGTEAKKHNSPIMRRIVSGLNADHVPRIKENKQHKVFVYNKEMWSKFPKKYFSIL